MKEDMTKRLMHVHSSASNQLIFSQTFLYDTILLICITTSNLASKIFLTKKGANLLYIINDYNH